MKHILVSGGAGYIGTHTCLQLLQAGYDVTIVDNLCNSSKEAVRRLEKLAGSSVTFFETDVRDQENLERIFQARVVDAVIHFAGLKAVGESVQKPLLYYENNLGSTLALLQAMARSGVKQLVFSSSATVYGNPETVPIREDARVQPTNPYGQTKAMIEQMLQDLAGSKEGWQIILLRYFNPIGAHQSGEIGEDPTGTPNNLVPFVAQVAVGKQPEVKIFGNDYPTPDGTGVRDYIHVLDLAKGHLAALSHMPAPNSAAIYNLGTGHGASVLEVIKSFEKACGKNLPCSFVGRRPGDIATCYADPSKANKELEWHASLTLDDACRDAWKWQSQNPDGYR